MRVPMAMFGGAVGCVIGAAIWTAVTYYTNYEIGWVAWGVGVLAGIGVFVGSGRRGDFALGVLAVLLALAGILAGKYAVAYASVHTYASSDDPYVAGIAEEILYERARNGETWPIVPTFAPDLLSIASEYPPQIWSEATSRWNAMSEVEQDEIRGMPYLINKQFHIVYLCDQLVEEYAQAGKHLAWSEGMSVEIAYREEDYPPELWADALSRWSAMSEADQRTYRDAMVAEGTAQSAEDKAAWETETINGAFLASFSLFDGLWAVLAILSAFKLGSASEDSSASAA
jgi:hypothetical protein